jgi:hypothetical protein
LSIGRDSRRSKVVGEGINDDEVDVAVGGEEVVEGREEGDELGEGMQAEMMDPGEDLLGCD